MVQVSGIILAGGKSSRMGTNKALIEVGEGKIIEKIVKGYREIFDEIIIISNEPELYEYLDVKVYKDIIPGKGPLSGIHSALTNSSNEYCFVMACDMPFLDQNLIKLLIKECEGQDITVPRLDKYLQPLYAIYSKNCIQPIEESLKKDIFKIIAFYSKVKVKYVEEALINSLVDPDKVFFNVNTREDLEKAKLINQEE